MFPIKILLQKKRDVAPDPEKWKGVDEEKYQIHTDAIYAGVEVLDEIYYVDGFALALARSVYSSDSTVNIDALLCTDLDGNVSIVTPEAVKVVVSDIIESYRNGIRKR